jgi:hypothetical protein
MQWNVLRIHALLEAIRSIMPGLFTILKVCAII